MHKPKILIIGQSPTPIHGQSIMIKYLVDHNFLNFETLNIKLDYSKNYNEIGKFNIKKIFIFFKIIFKILKILSRNKIELIYYPPAGANPLPVYRDIINLLIIKLFNRNIILHIHASGLNFSYRKLNVLSKYFFRLAFFNNKCIVVLSEYSKNEMTFLKSKITRVIPNGIFDHSKSQLNYKLPNQENSILFIGGGNEEKGIFTFLDALIILRQNGYNFTGNIIGYFDKKAGLKFEQYKNYLKDNLVFNFEKFDGEKWTILAQTTVFCFPTHYKQETFGIVLLEAMQFSKPIIASNWHGINEIIENNVNGLLSIPGDSKDLANKIMLILDDALLQKRLGNAGRISYDTKYTLNTFTNNFNDLFTDLLLTILIIIIY